MRISLEVEPVLAGAPPGVALRVGRWALSDIATRYLGCWCCRYFHLRDADADQHAAPGPARQAEGAAHQFRALAHADEANPATVGRRRRAGGQAAAGVLDLQRQRALRLRQPDPRLRRPRMPADVAQRFLDDAIQVN